MPHNGSQATLCTLQTLSFHSLERTFPSAHRLLSPEKNRERPWKLARARVLYHRLQEGTDVGKCPPYQTPRRVIRASREPAKAPEAVPRASSALSVDQGVYFKAKRTPRGQLGPPGSAAPFSHARSALRGHPQVCAAVCRLPEPDSPGQSAPRMRHQLHVPGTARPAWVRGAYYAEPHSVLAFDVIPTEHTTRLRPGDQTGVTRALAEASRTG